MPTLRETPADAEIISHKLLLRAGIARKLTGGLYTFLPAGVRVLRKIETIVREEMNRAGALEVLMPALQPPEIWQRSGRYDTASEVFFRVKDRARKEWILGPTHEEVITTMVADELNSYRQFPRNFYQIQTKFRDEIRPRFGLMRAKEFIMKDAYSFDCTDEAAQTSYQKMYDAYSRIFKRCGLQAIPVEADTGVMGGKFSHEFVVPAESGEDEVVYSEGGRYAANVEKAACKPFEPIGTEADAALPIERFATPGVGTIDDLTCEPFGVPAWRQIKTLVYVVESKPILVLLRGDHSLNEAKLTGVLGTAKFRPATADEILELLKAHPGSLGAVGVAHVPVYADEALRNCRGMVTGANEDGWHLRHVVTDRDLSVGRWADLRTVRAGDLCPVTGEPLKLRRAIEVGHVFKLGTKYSIALNALFLDESGKQQPAFMGCYGIGITRTLQAVIEQCHDQDGILWPATIAPYTVCITPLSADPNSQVMQVAEQIYAELGASGVEVLMDDRNERPGVKFKDADLIGFPIRVGIGEKSLANGNVEVKRRGGALTAVKVGEATCAVRELLKGCLANLNLP